MSLLLVHVVWATCRRLPVLGIVHDGPLERELRKVARGIGTTLHAYGGADDHVHVLVQMPPEASVATLVNRLKGASSHAFRRILPVQWQAGYWAESVSVDAAPATAAYVRGQREHHAAGVSDEAWQRT